MGSKEHVMQQMLASLFGDNWASIFAGTGAEALSQSAIFELLTWGNTMALYSITALLAAAWILGIGHTAGQGKAGGNAVHVVYTPLRIATATVLASPLPWMKGLCLLQALVLALVGFGIGFAGKGIGVAVDYMAEHGGAMTPPPQYVTRTIPAVQGLSRTGTLYYYLGNAIPGATVRLVGPEWVQEELPPSPKAAAKTNKGIMLSAASPLYALGTMVYHAAQKVGGYITGDSAAAAAAHAAGHYSIYATAQTPAREAHNRPPVFLGGVDIPCQDLSSSACKMRLASTREMLFSAFAARCQAAASLSGPADRLAITCPKSTLTVPQTAARYIKNMGQVSVTMAEEQVHNLKEHLKMQAEVIKKSGFALLGAWYWTFIHSQNSMAAVSNLYPIYVPPDVNALESLSPGDDDKRVHKAIQHVLVEAQMDFNPEFIRSTLARAARIENRSASEFDDLKNQGLAQEMIAGMKSKVHEFMNTIHETTTKSVEGMVAAVATGEPLLHMANVGHILIGGGETLFGAYVVARAATGAVSPLPILSGASAATSAVSPAIIGAVITLVLFGAALAFYLPMIPSLLWTIAVVGYLLEICLMMILAPVLAATYAFPGGAGFVHQRSVFGNLFAIDLMFRPYIMVAAFFMANVVMSMAGILLGFGFIITFEAITQGHLVGIVTIFTTMALMIGAINWFGHYIYKFISLAGDKFQSFLGGAQGISMSSHTESGHNYIAGAVSTGSREGKTHVNAAATSMMGGAAGRGKSGLPGSNSGSGGKGGAGRDMTNADTPNRGEEQP